MSIFPRHRSVLRFAFEGRAYKYKVLPFRLSLLPRVFMKVVEAALVPLREQGVRILNYLDDWLILAQSQDQSTKGLEELGKEQTLPDAEDLFSRYRVGFGQSECASRRKRTQLVLNCLNTFKNRTAAPLKQFQRLLGHMATAVTPLGLLHMRPLKHWLHGRVPRWAWQSGTLLVQVTPACRQTFTPWSDLSFLRFTRMPSPRAGGPRFGGLDGSPTALAHQLPRLAGSTPGLEPSQETLTKRARTGLYRQHCDRHVHQPTRWSMLPSQLVRHLLLWSRKHLRSLRAIHIPGLLNRTADELSRAALPGEWRIHPQTVQLI